MPSATMPNPRRKGTANSQSIPDLLSNGTAARMVSWRELVENQLTPAAHNGDRLDPATRVDGIGEGGHGGDRVGMRGNDAAAIISRQVSPD